MMVFDDVGKVISAVRSAAEFNAALISKPIIILDLGADIISVGNRLNIAHENGKKLYVNIDLARGIGKDESGIAYLKEIGVDGIVSTKNNIVKIAREKGLNTVQHFFVVDSQSIVSVVETIKSSKPDMMEIMPGIALKAIRRLKELTDMPIIAGGLIDMADEVQPAIEAGAVAIITGKQELWNI